MGESSLSSSYRDFQSQIGFFLGYGIDYTKWEADKITIVDKIIQSGLKKFYNPPLMQGQNERHTWSFLNLPGTIQTIVPYSTGTVSSSGATVTLVDGTWPTWAATNGSLTVDNVSYTISTMVSGSVITLSEDPETDFTGKTFVLSHNGNYDMPDDWNGWKSTFLTFVPNDYDKIIFCSEGMIRSLRANDSSGTPSKAAWRAKPGTTLTGGQRFELMLWPIPDSEYVIEGIYNVFQNKIDPTTYPFPMGGSSHDRTIAESMLSEAEISINDTAGLHNELFMNFLAASIKEDEAKEPDFYGYNGAGIKAFNGVTQRKTYVTYEGVLYEGEK